MCRGTKQTIFGFGAHKSTKMRALEPFTSLWVLRHKHAIKKDVKILWKLLIIINQRRKAKVNCNKYCECVWKLLPWYTFYYYLSLLSRDLTNYLLLFPYFYVVLCDHTAFFSFFFEVHLSAWYCMKYYLGGGCMFLFLFSYETANNNNNNG